MLPTARARRSGLAGLLLAPLVAACAAGARPGTALSPAASHAAAAGYASPAYDAGARDLTADEQVRHALARVTFGARPGDVERVRAEGVDRWIDRQLDAGRISDPIADAVLARYPNLGRTGAELMAAYPPPAQLLVRQAALRRMGAASATPGMADTTAAAGALGAADSARLGQLRRASYRFVGELQTARVARAVASERQLQEVMTDFWENHFNVFVGKNQLRYALPEYDATVRAHALGRFRDLLGAVAHSPAMLYYLDNWQSTADSGAPTLADGGGRRARPLLAARPGGAPPPRARRGLNENYGRELLELHTLGVDGGYTQQDVQAVARALTGWSVRVPARGGGFVFRREAHDAGEKTILGQRFPAGRGQDEGERVLDLVARHPSTARHLARKLCVRFVSDTPPPPLVARAAEAFTRTDGDVRATLAVILHSPEFFSRAAYRAKVKTPLELVASAARALGAPADTTPRSAQLVARLGQPLWGHQAPDGWPETGAPWVNTGSILNRINFGAAVAAGRVPGVRLATWPAYPALRAADRPAQIDGVVAALLGGEASPDTRAILLRGENPLAARAAAAAAAADDAAPPPARPLRSAEPLAQLVGLALGAPEFQRR
jgi:uncharacterized protein (DUF1800 family)